jgi:two-component system, response regulator
MDHKFILLVEDSPDEVALTKLAFQKNLIIECLVVVNDGKQALDYLFCCGAYSDRDPQKQPALILLDLNLPLVGGLEVLRKVKADRVNSSIPVVVLTSSSEESDKAECAKIGVDKYLRKPTGFAEFIEIVRQVKTDYLVADCPIHPKQNI